MFRAMSVLSYDYELFIVIFSSLIYTTDNEDNSWIAPYKYDIAFTHFHPASHYSLESATKFVHTSAIRDTGFN